MAQRKTISNAFNVTTIEDADNVRPNLLVGTVFERGLDWIKANWTSNNWEQVYLSTTATIEGRKCVSLVAEPSTVGEISFGHTIKTLVKPSTWYTFSFYSISWNFYALLFGNYYSGGSCLYDETEGITVDGEKIPNPADKNGYIAFTNYSNAQRHTITFKTASVIPTAATIYFVQTVGDGMDICMPKLEEGKTATAYMAHEDDLVGEAIETNQNILKGTYFERGLDFIQRSWVCYPNDWSRVVLDVETDTKVNGRSGIRITIPSSYTLEAYFDLKENVLTALRPNTWYTLSFNYFADGTIETFIYCGSASIVNVSEGIYVDGVKRTTDANASCQWAAQWRGERHYMSFKTKSSFTGIEYAQVTFRTYRGYQTSLCMPKLEEGQIATPYTPHEEDLVGDVGKTGKFYYYAGVWENTNVPFVVSDVQAPYFEYTKNGNKNYWLFDPKENGTYTMAQMGEPSSSAANWKLMTNDFKYIITEAIFGSFAHFGGAIINEDWMISQYGNNVGSATGYQYFDPFVPKGNTYICNNFYFPKVWTSETFSLVSNRTYTFNVTLSTISSFTFKVFREGDSSASYETSVVNSSTSAYTKTITFTPSTLGNYYVVLIANATVGCYASITTNITGKENLCTSFYARTAYSGFGLFNLIANKTYRFSILTEDSTRIEIYKGTSSSAIATKETQSSDVLSFTPDESTAYRIVVRVLSSVVKNMFITVNAYLEDVFVPNYALDLRTGKVYMQNADISGNVNATSIVARNEDMITSIEAGVLNVKSTKTSSYATFMVNSNGEVVLQMFDKDGKCVVNLGGDPNRLVNGSWKAILLYPLALDEADLSNRREDYIIYNDTPNVGQYYELHLGKIQSSGSTIEYYYPDGTQVTSSDDIAKDGKTLLAANVNANAIPNMWYMIPNNGIFEQTIQEMDLTNECVTVMYYENGKVTLTKTIYVS